MKNRIRINQIIRFLKIDKDFFNEIILRCDFEKKEYRIVDFLNLSQTEIFFKEYGKYLYESFLIDKLEREKKAFDFFKKQFPLKCLKKELQYDFQLFNLIADYFNHDNPNRLKRDIYNFSKKSSFSKQPEFVKLQNHCENQDFDENYAKDLILKLSSFFANIQSPKKQDERIEMDLNEKEVSLNDDDGHDETDWEEIIMNSFKNGEQDRFGL